MTTDTEVSHGVQTTVNRYGGPEQLIVTNQPTFQPTPGHAIVANTAVGVNFIDIYHRTGLYPKPRPFTPGVEGVGIVEAAEELPLGVKLGDRVGYIGPFGSYASRTLVPAHRLVPLPDDIDDHTAAAILLQGITTYALLEVVHQVRPGETILIHAAAGGLGLLMCQWAAAMGATVIGTVSSEEKAAVAAANGCTHPLLNSSPDWAEQVMHLTGGRGVAVAYDSIGRDTFERSLASLRVRGLLVSLGQSSGPPAPLDVPSLGAKGSLTVTRPSVFDFVQTRDDLLTAADRLFARIRTGDIRVTPPRTYPLDAASAAHADLQNRMTIGSLILLPNSSGPLHPKVEHATTDSS